MQLQSKLKEQFASELEAERKRAAETAEERLKAQMSQWDAQSALLKEEVQKAAAAVADLQEENGKLRSVLAEKMAMEVMPDHLLLNLYVIIQLLLL